MGLLRCEGAGRAVERRIAVAEDAAVGGDEPVAVAVRRGGHADDGLAQREPGQCRGAQRRGSVVRRDRARGAVRPVAAVGIGGHHLATAIGACAHCGAGTTGRFDGQAGAQRAEQTKERHSSCNEDYERPPPSGLLHRLPPHGPKEVGPCGRRATECSLLIRRPGELLEFRSFASLPHGRFAFSFNSKDGPLGVAGQGAIGPLARNYHQQRVN